MQTKVEFGNHCRDCECSCVCQHDCKGDAKECTSDVAKKKGCNHHYGCTGNALALAIRNDPYISKTVKTCSHEK